MLAMPLLQPDELLLVWQSGDTSSVQSQDLAMLLPEVAMTHQPHRGDLSAGLLEYSLFISLELTSPSCSHSAKHPASSPPSLRLGHGPTPPSGQKSPTNPIHVGTGGAPPPQHPSTLLDSQGRF